MTVNHNTDLTELRDFRLPLNILLSVSMRVFPEALGTQMTELR